MQGSSSASRSGLVGGGSSRTGGSQWLNTLVETNTLTGLFDTQSQQGNPMDDAGDNTLFRELDIDSALKELVNEKALEPLMGIDKASKAELDKKNALPVKTEPPAKPANGSVQPKIAPPSKPAKERKAPEPKRKIAPAPVAAPTSVSGGQTAGSVAPRPVGTNAGASSMTVQSATASFSNPSSSVAPSSSAVKSLPQQPKPPVPIRQPGATSTTIVNTTPSSTSSGSKRVSKSEPSSGSKTDSTADSKKKALQVAFSAFLHLHQPCMTKAEQSAMLAHYDGRETELWQDLAKRFGKDSVPARFLRPNEAAKGSMRIQLTPKAGGVDGDRTLRTMLEKGLDTETKQTISRTTTVAQLTSDLEFRWKSVDDHLKKSNLKLFLFSVGSDRILPARAVVRDSIVDGCIEFCWCSPDRYSELVEEEDSWGGGHSLSGLPTSMSGFEQPTKTLRRIQPLQISQDSNSKRIHADVTMTDA